MFCILRTKTPAQIWPNFRKLNTYSVENLMNDENRSRTMAKFGAMKPIRLQTHTPVKKAAVFIPLCIVDHKVSLMYIVVPSVLTDYKEKVNFPGDIKQPEDKSFPDTAVRACQNLLGISRDNLRIWGEGRLIVPRANFSFIPVIGELQGPLNLNTLRMHPEIEEVFTVPIEDLCNTKMTAYTQFKDEYSAPVFMGGKWRIWGFTGMVTNLVLKSLVPSQGYIHRMKQVPTIKQGTTFPRTRRTR